MPIPKPSLIEKPLSSTFDKYRPLRGGNSQQRSAAVHRPLRYHLRPLSAHRDSREFGDDSPDGIGHLAFGPDGHTHVRRDEHSNVTIAGGQERIGGLAAQQIGQDAAHHGRNLHAAEDIADLNAAGAGFALDASGGADFDRPRRVTGNDNPIGLVDNDAASTAGGGHGAARLGDMDAPGAGLRAHLAAHFGGHDIAALGGEDGFPAHGSHGDASGARGAVEGSLDAPDANVATASKELAIAANAVHRQLAAAGIHNQVSIDAADIDGAVGGGDSGGGQVRGFHGNSGQEGTPGRGQDQPIALRRQSHGISAEDAERLGGGAGLDADLHLVGHVGRNTAFERYRAVRHHPQARRGGGAAVIRAHPLVALAGNVPLRERHQGQEGKSGPSAKKSRSRHSYP